MFYELWDLDAGNIIGDYDTEADALQVVRDLLDADNPEFVEALSLGRTADDGQFTLVAEGQALAARAGVHTARRAAGP